MTQKKGPWVPRREGDTARIIKFPTPEERSDRDLERHIQTAMEANPESWRKN
jgi:hypothetical protein